MPAEPGAVSSTAVPSHTGPAPCTGGEGAVPEAQAQALAARLARHWRRTRLLTFGLVALWLGVVLGVGLFARPLAQVRFFGWPLSYYMGAQGALVLFLAIIGVYALAMRYLDRQALGPPPAQAAAPEPERR